MLAEVSVGVARGRIVLTLNCCCLFGSLFSEFLFNPCGVSQALERLQAERNLADMITHPDTDSD